MIGPTAIRILGASGIAALVAWAGVALQGTALTPDAATSYINKMGDRAVAVLATEAEEPVRHREFARLMIDAIDFEAIALQTLGRMARTVSQHDKQEFTQLFAAHVIEVAIERFGNIQIIRFKASEGRMQPNGDAKVHTRIEREGGEPLSVDWRVRSTAGGPKINDIEVEGYSLVIHYRGEFERGQVSNVPGLISKLKGMHKNTVVWDTVQREMR
ncbi:MAG: ABC transporter substrate-binding protein [Alphaproteobacteria bacterium]|nr:ABC transporter substrate-binding protein [Alphaproteobacteria bacterium]